MLFSEKIPILTTSDWNLSLALDLNNKNNRWWLFSPQPRCRCLFGKSREIFTMPAFNGRNKLRTHTVDYRELFKLRRKLRSEWSHLRITLNVICFMLTIFSYWCRVSMAHDPMDDHKFPLVIDSWTLSSIIRVIISRRKTLMMMLLYHLVVAERGRASNMRKHSLKIPKQTQNMHKLTTCKSSRCPEAACYAHDRAKLVAREKSCWFRCFKVIKIMFGPKSAIIRFICSGRLISS